MPDRLNHLSIHHLAVRKAVAEYKHRVGKEPWDDLTPEESDDFEREFCRSVILPSNPYRQGQLYMDHLKPNVREVVDEYKKKMGIPLGADLTEREHNEADRYVAARVLEMSVNDEKAV